jgi:hypothetical protein
MANILTDTGLMEFLGGLSNNPAYQQGKIGLGNQQFINDQARQAYMGQLNGIVPQQGVAGFDPQRLAGLQTQLGAAQGTGADLANMGAGTLGAVQSGAVTGQNALQRIAGGMTSPQFGSGVANQYQNFMSPSLLGAQQALNNQANMAWNKGAAGVGGAAGGFMSSGRNAALGQAQENAATQLGAQQQQLAYNAAQQAAAAGQQAGMLGYQGQLSAGSQLGNQALQGAQLTGSLQQSQLLPGQIQEGMGSLLQQQNQNQLNADYLNQTNQFQNPFKALQNYNAGLGVMGSSNFLPDISTPNNLMTALNMGGYGNVANLGNALSSLYGAGSSLWNSMGGLNGIGNTLGNAWDSASSIFDSASPAVMPDLSGAPDIPTDLMDWWG